MHQLQLWLPYSSMGIPIPRSEVQSFVRQTGWEGFKQACANISLNAKGGFVDEEATIAVKA